MLYEAMPCIDNTDIALNCRLYTDWLINKDIFVDCGHDFGSFILSLYLYLPSLASIGLVIAIDCVVNVVCATLNPPR